MLRNQWIAVRKTGARLASFGTAVVRGIESAVYYVGLALVGLLVFLTGVGLSAVVVYNTVNSVHVLWTGFANGIGGLAALLVACQLLSVFWIVMGVRGILHVCRSGR